MKNGNGALALCLLVPLVMVAMAGAEEPEGLLDAGQTAPSRAPSSVVQAPVHDEPEQPLRWFVYVGLVNAYPKLEREELIERYFNPAMRLVAPGFDDVRTVRSLRDEYKLWVPQFGVGRIVGRRWSLFLQGGYTAGKVRSKSDDLSIFLLPLHTDFEIKRGALSTTLGVDFFPFGVVRLKEYDGILERLRGTKPKVGSSLTWTYATFTAKIKAGLKPFPNVLDIELSNAWYLPSINTNIGMDIPLGPRTSLGFNVGYNHYWEQEGDFEGPAFNVTWNYFFK